MANRPLFFLIAGEASGDLLGARLMAALKKRTQGNVQFAGVGGPRMQAEGMDLLFPQAELAHFGFFELIGHIPHILKRIRETSQAIKRQQPAALITIDAPDFCFRVAKKVKATKIPLIHYVAPTVWAWRPKRAHTIAQFLTHLLTLLPFEPPYFTKEGLGCTFVGHPIVENGADKGQAQRFYDRHGLTPSTQLLTVLPGSRRSEVARLMPIFGATLHRLKQQHPALHVVIPVAPMMAASLKEQARLWDVPVIITETDDDKYDAFAASRAALACSGTVALELALARLPAVITYKISTLTYYLYRRLIKVRFANLVNIMHDRMVVPELLQQDCTPEKLASAVHDLLSQETLRQQQIKGLGEVGAWLGQGQFVPSERAADQVLRVLDQSLALSHP